MNSSKSMLAAAEPALKRALGAQVPFEGTDGLYTQSWYAICLSSEIEAGAVRGFPFLGGKVIVFRGENGIVQVSSAYCPHLGADLSLGTVVGNRVQCPYHFWQFDREGACRQTGCGDPPPPRAKLFAFPTMEKHGLIWAFNGTAPRYALPDWPLDEEALVTDTQVFPVEMPVDPWIICAQTPDIQHVILLHRFELQGGDPSRSIAWTDHSMFYDVRGIAQGRMMDIRAGIIGTTLFFQTGTLDGRWFGFMTAMGLPAPGRTTLFSVFAAERTSDIAEVKAFLEEARAHEIAIASEDADIAATIHFKVGSLTRQDAPLARFLAYVRDYPRAHPSAEFIV